MGNTEKIGANKTKTQVVQSKDKKGQRKKAVEKHKKDTKPKSEQDRILEKYQKENWDKLSLEEKKAVNKETSAFFAKELKLKNPPEVTYADLGNPKIYGGLSEDGEELRINNTTLEDPKLTFQTFAHENRHAYQRERSVNPKTEKERQWKKNLQPGNYYAPPENGNTQEYQRYKEQPVEADAFAYGDAWRSKVK